MTEISLDINFFRCKSTFKETNYSISFFALVIPNFWKVKRTNFVISMDLKNQERVLVDIVNTGAASPRSFKNYVVYAT